MRVADNVSSLSLLRSFLTAKVSLINPSLRLMRDYLYIGPAPCEEQCVQVTSEGGYTQAMRAECMRFIALIREVLGSEPEGARLAIKREDHDFGSYYEVVCHYETDLPESVDYAYRCESDAPTKWDAAEPTKDSLHPEGL